MNTTDKKGKILAIDDNEDILFSLKLLLKPHVEFIHTEVDPEKIPDLLKKEKYDVILLDMNFTKDAISGQEGFDWLSKIVEIDPDAVVVFIGNQSRGLCGLRLDIAVIVQMQALSRR